MDEATFSHIDILESFKSLSDMCEKSTQRLKRNGLFYWYEKTIYRHLYVCGR